MDYWSVVVLECWSAGVR